MKDSWKKNSKETCFDIFVSCSKKDIETHQIGSLFLDHHPIHPQLEELQLCWKSREGPKIFDLQSTFSASLDSSELHRWVQRRLGRQCPIPVAQPTEVTRGLLSVGQGATNQRTNQLKQNE